MDEINWGLIGPLLALQVLLAITGLVSLARADKVRGPKWLWVFIIIFGNLIGSIAYFTVGRKEI